MRWTKSTLFAQTEGGIRRNLHNHKEKVSTDVQEGESIRKNFAEQSSLPFTKTENNSNCELRNTNFMGKEGCGKTVNLTPVKRKLIINKQVSKLVPVFDNTHVLSVSTPGACETEESPAKKRKLEHGGGVNTL